MCFEDTERAITHVCQCAINQYDRNWAESTDRDLWDLWSHSATTRSQTLMRSRRCVKNSTLNVTKTARYEFADDEMRFARKRHYSHRTRACVFSLGTVVQWGALSVCAGKLCATHPLLCDCVRVIENEKATRDWKKRRQRFSGEQIGDLLPPSRLKLYYNFYCTFFTTTNSPSVQLGSRQMEQ